MLFSAVKVRAFCAIVCPIRYRANMAHIGQSMPDAGIFFQGKILETFYVVPFSVGSGQPCCWVAFGGCVRRG